MAIVLFVLGLLAWAAAAVGFAAAPTVSQEIAALQMGIGGAVLIAGGAIVSAIQQLHTTVALAATPVVKKPAAGE